MPVCDDAPSSAAIARGDVLCFSQQEGGRIHLVNVRNKTATGDPVTLGLLEQETGQISGVALDREGQPLAGHTVRATRVFTLVNTDTGATQNAGTATTDTSGQFSFTGHRASDYLVEVLSGDEVVANTSVTLADDAMRVTGLTVSGLADDSGMSRRTKWIIVGVAATGTPCPTGYWLSGLVWDSPQLFRLVVTEDQ